MNLLTCLRTFGLVMALLPIGLRGADFAAERQRAEDFYARGSFAQAREVLRQLNTNGLPPADARWLRFRLADTQWRALGGGELLPAEESAPDLVELARPDVPAGSRDQFWADANRSLADFHRRRGDPTVWVANRFGAALEWWAGQTNLPVARQQYLAIARDWVGQPGGNYAGFPGGEAVPDAVVDHAVELAQSPADIARFRLLRATRFANRDGPRSLGQVERDFDAARAAAPGTPWLDQVLYHEGQWRERAGRLTVGSEGRWERRPDLAGALARYQRLVEEFKPGTSRFRGAAERRIVELTRAAVGLGQTGVFVPGSEIQFWLWTRNAAEVTLTLRPVELTRDVRFNDPAKNSGEWLDLLKAPDGAPLRTWTESLVPPGPHEQAGKMIRLSDKLAPGAYLLEARAGDQSARDLILVTDAVLVLQQTGGRTAAWLVDAFTGRPVPEAPVKLGLYARIGDRDQWRWKEQARSTDVNGLAVFDLAGGQMVAVAGTATRPAVALLSTGWGESSTDEWKIFAFTDRPAYRPGDLVHWKILARRNTGGQYRTPAGKNLHFAIKDSDGSTVTNGVAKLDAFGAAWGELTLTAQQLLGEYRVAFSEDAAGEKTVGEAVLFRLEEYRLPEFEVTVTAPEAKESEGAARRSLLRPGDPLRAVIEARYFFGAPVSGGRAEVIVRRRPFQWYWPEPREFPWLYASSEPEDRPWNHPSEELRRETLTLDANGRATFTQETDPDAADAVYSLEASVTDPARRTERAEADFKVTRQGYAVRGQPAHNLPRPGDAVRVEFRSQDANEQPVSVEGAVKITRDFWWEIWLDSFGREVQGDELKRRQAQSSMWPPKPEPGQKDWRLKFRGYRSDELATRSVKLGTNGVGELSFTPEREGYYRFAWSSPDLWAIPGAPVTITNQIRAEATVWVTTAQTTDLGYRPGGVQIVVDQDAFRVGQKAPVLIVGPNPDRWVLFTVEGGATAPQVLSLANPTRLVELDVTEALEPNFFLHAALVQDRQILTDTKEIVVPPLRHFLQVRVEPDRGEYRPGAEGNVRVTTRDAEGKPVAAEVALSVVDESLFKIQKDLAGDPRQFFFGDRRASGFQLSSSFQNQNYVRWVKGPGDVWYDDRFPPTGEGVDDESGSKAKERAALGLPVSLDTVMLTAALTPAAGSAPMKLGRELALNSRSAAGLATAPPGNGAGDSSGAVVVVRSDFRETAVWQPNVMTGGDGQAQITVHYPDSTTRWETRAIAATTGSEFGEGRTNTVTRLPLMARLQTPRFLVAGDEATISASLDNNTSAPLTVTPTLAVEGVELLGWYHSGILQTGPPAAVEVPAGGGARVDWAVRAPKPGPAKFTVTARSPGLADAMQRELTVVEYGLEQLLARSGKAPAGDVTVNLDLPPRKPGSTHFSVTVTPSLAVTMLDALPYLADYPYGCTEQTLSRFLPAVIVQRTLADLGLDAATAMQRAFGGITTNGAGRVSPALGSKKDLGKLDDMIAVGLKRLSSGQGGNGAWGWWPGGNEDPWMTAYVVWGLRLAQQAGVTVEEERLARAEQWLREHLVDFEHRPDDAAWALHALSARRVHPGQPVPDPLEARAFEQVYAQRTELNAGTRALLALAAHRYGYASKAKVLVENLENGVVREDRPDASVIYGGTVQGGSTVPTVHWGDRGSFRRWSDGSVEATAFALRALLAIDPKNALVEPAAAWLLQNRRGASWNNTRDTAITLLALTDYLRVTGESKPTLDAEIVVNGQPLTRLNLTPADLLRAPGEFAVPEAWLRDHNEVRIVRKGGTAPVYFQVQARFFSRETPIAPAGADLFVRREYFKLVPVETLLKGVIEQRVPVAEGDPVASGDLVECRLVFEGKNEGEYLLLEDHKPAGFEALETQSGWGPPARKINAAQAQAAGPDLAESTATEALYFEWRDRKAAIFAAHLGTGFWEIRYRYRAETPGRFTALPAVAGAMYVPELRANSASREVHITEAAR